MGKFYFAVKDGAYDPETGERYDAGMMVSADGIEDAEEMQAFVEQELPSFKGRLRQITEEEYIRDYGDDEDE
jgi:hypothetical protein